MPENNRTIEELKEELNRELTKKDSDNSVILKLSHELASLDNNTLRFSVDAGMINRLGRELVGRHETAVAELVKNAYDADATSVTISFNKTDNPNGQIIINDNGLGMDRDQLIKGFMTISSTDKIHNPKSTKFKRVRAGQKGIGRFSTQRIGKKLTIITQTQLSPKALKLQVDWDKYEIDGDLFLISNNVDEIDKIKEEGTTLIIDEVRDIWSLAMIKKTFTFISDLLQPFPLSTRLEQSQGDPGFKVDFYKDSTILIDEESAFFQHALAQIEGYVDNDGQGFYSFKSEKLNIDEDVILIGKEERDIPYIKLKNVHFKAYYFIWNSGYIPKGVEKHVRENARKNGGIRLYRNGFRVLPYGEPNNDWLRLDASVVRNTIIAPHGNMNYFGFVEVVDKEGELFQEQSSREGLLENEALEELRDFVYKVITDVAIKVSSFRDRKGLAGQKDFERKFSGDIIKDVKSQVEEIINISNNNEASTGSNRKIEIVEKLKVIEQSLVEIEETTKSERVELEVKTKELLKEIQLLRILAGLGQAIGEFIHEIDHYQPALKYDAEFLTATINSNAGKITGERLLQNISALNVYTSYFRDAISNNVNRELEPIELRIPIQKFLSNILPDLRRSKIELVGPIFHGYNLFTCPMHISEWASILFNLYTNAKKAINKARTNGRISIVAGKTDQIVYVEFMDNGIGIPDKDKNDIFNAFFTTSSPTGVDANEIQEAIGTGLGLKIVKDIIEGYGGKIYVAESSNDFKTTIRIELPKQKNNV
ncbi:sensor histidine kinase [Sphingobacterium detergens]|uniref:histidine kinase n=1 Tax=Sphingobacterium detergens TaxID=1145106 RepID=A0A420B6T1_SPHD1|nr:sensor histidine kinase [Sphingobacterium detergens]RKE52382.1 histidine kinase [Sphingobacterium detergens]